MIIKTFKDLQDDALRWYDEVENASELRDNIKQAIAAAHVTRLSERNWPFMRWHEPIQFTLTAGQQVYALHQEFFKPIYFYNVTAKRWMREFDDTTVLQTIKRNAGDRWSDANSAWPDNSASAIYFQLRGVMPVAQQPSAASVLSVSSSSESDASSQTVVVRGETSTGAVVEETIACDTTGTTSFQTILKVTKVGTWSGTMTLAAGATTLLQLGAEEDGRLYRTLRFLQDPDAADTVEYDFYRQPHPLVRDNDIPEIPSPFQDILVYDALIDLATYNDVEPAALKVWMQRQAKLENALLEAHSGEALSLEREISYVNYIPRD